MHHIVCVCVCVYRRHSNYASFLILHQNATFQTSDFQWCVTLQKLISYCCITWSSWLQNWTVIVACHRWCIKLRHIPDVAETLLVVRDGNGNRNSSPTFLSSVWGHLRIPRVSKNMDTSCMRKSNNGKRSGNKHDWFAVVVLEDETLCTVSGESLVFLGRPGPLFVCFVGGSALGFHDIGSGASFERLK